MSSSGVAMNVVDLLEVIHVDHHDRQAVLVPLGQGHLALQELLHRAAVVQARQGVGEALLLGLEYRYEQTTDTFAIRRFLTTAAIERKFWDNWKINYGALLEEARVTRHVTETNEHLIGFPVTLTRDTSGDLYEYLLSKIATEF